jgi:SAM-dependent methyltransferase
MPDDYTLEFYAANAADYVGHGQDGPSSQLRAFAQSLDPQAKILELGTGSGRDAEFLLKSGFDVMPTDASAELAVHAEERLGRAVNILRFDALEDVSQYEGVWACACLLHAPASELTDDLSRIHRALKPSGLFVASFKAGTGEGRDSFGRYYNYPSAETLLTHYREAASWSELELQSVVGSGYDNLATQWLWVTARR